jgi:ABC-2 type transport system permease protein
MSTLSYAVRDTSTMLRRNLLHMRRYPLLTFMLVMVPVIIMLLFVFVFGGTLGAGLGEIAGGRAEYANYVTPGILMLCVASSAQGTAITIAMDMTEGIIARFKTMRIFRPSVLTGHVAGSVLQALLGMAFLIGVAYAVGFRPDSTPLEWLAVAGLLTLVAIAMTWISVACGLVSKSVEAASNLPMPLMLLPFLGSGFVPTESMPGPMRWFAEYQPFTPVMETLRGLFFGTAIGSNAVIAVGWCAALTVVCYVWAKRLYNRER